MQATRHRARKQHTPRIAALEPQQVSRVAVRVLGVEAVGGAPVQHARARAALQARGDVGGALAQAVGPGARRGAPRQRHVRVRDLAGLVRQRGRAAERRHRRRAVGLGWFALGLGEVARGLG